jgi:predicted nucleic acid-binding Zn ribbon protein
MSRRARARAARGRRGDQPRTLGEALRPVRAEAAPATLLGAVQGVWGQVAGTAIAAEAEAVAERDGVVTVACRSATWAQELDLLHDELLDRLNTALAAAERARSPGEAGFRAERLRFTADAARHDR